MTSGRVSRRAAIYGGDDLRSAAAALGLEPCEAGRPDLVLVDLRDPSACVAAAALESGIPRVAVAGDEERALAAALGYDASSIAATCEPAALGPLVVAALPRTPRRATRVVVITATRGGVGRTLLVANLARRLASRLRVAAIDATGTGALGWWLRCAPRAWTELEGLTDELTGEHLAVVATESVGLRVIGGAPVAPTRALAESTVRAATSLVELVLVDAPLLADERARALASLADRVIVVSYDDPLSIATLDASEVSSDVWLVASQSRTPRVGEHAAFRALPRDEAAVGAALSGRGAAGGALGRAYHELAELIALDAS
jgi:Mrp family chromosome partitioning ATPase